jgi:hypothetical protein
VKTFGLEPPAARNKKKKRKEKKWFRQTRYLKPKNAETWAEQLESTVRAIWWNFEGTPHVDLVEGGEHSVRVLSLLQSLSDPLSHAVHLHSGFRTGSGDLLSRVARRQLDSGPAQRLRLL